MIHSSSTSLGEGNRKEQYISVVNGSQRKTGTLKNQIKRGNALESKYNDIPERPKIQNLKNDPS